MNTYAEPIKHYCIIPQTFMNVSIPYCRRVREPDYLHFTDEELGEGGGGEGKQPKNPTDDLTELFQEIWQIKSRFLQSQSTALKSKIFLIVSRNLNFQLAKKYKRNKTRIHALFHQCL